MVALMLNAGCSGTVAGSGTGHCDERAQKPNTKMIGRIQTTTLVVAHLLDIVVATNYPA